MRERRGLVKVTLLAAAALRPSGALDNGIPLTPAMGWSRRGLGPAFTRRVITARAEGAFVDWPDLMRRVRAHANAIENLPLALLLLLPVMSAVTSNETKQVEEKQASQTKAKVGHPGCLDRIKYARANLGGGLMCSPPPCKK